MMKVASVCINKKSIILSSISNKNVSISCLKTFILIFFFYINMQWIDYLLNLCYHLNISKKMEIGCFLKTCVHQLLHFSLSLNSTILCNRKTLKVLEQEILFDFNQNILKLKALSNSKSFHDNHLHKSTFLHLITHSLAL